MKLDKGNILIVNWDTTRDKYGYCHPEGKSSVTRKEIEWLEESFGYDGPNGKWHHHRSNYFFKKEKDLIKILLINILNLGKVEAKEVEEIISKKEIHSKIQILYMKRYCRV